MKRPLTCWFLLVWICAAFLLPASAAQAQSNGGEALFLVADGPVSSSMAGFIERGIATAEQRGSELLIIQLNTPGGGVTVMNRIVQEIRASSVPVVVYVAPAGAMAGSAGTLITLAGHAAAMAPETAIGAASPVGSQGEDLGETMAAKEKNILRATARSLAERRGPEAVQLAESTIQDAEAASSTEALSTGLVDIVARDPRDLLNQLDGREVTLDDGTVIRLETRGIPIVPLQTTFIETLLNLLTNPNIVFVLMTIGVQAILIELSSPGGWVAGFIGVVCLAIAIYGLIDLPVNWFGIVFLIISFVLFILDIKAPTHGALTIAGVGTFILGALMLFNSPGVPQFQRVSVPLVIGTGIFTAAGFFTILTIALRAQRAPAAMGRETLIGKTGTARTGLNPNGTVQVAGEQWSAHIPEGEAPIPAGTRVVVVAVDGLRLVVRSAIS